MKLTNERLSHFKFEQSLCNSKPISFYPSAIRLACRFHSKKTNLRTYPFSFFHMKRSAGFCKRLSIGAIEEYY